MSERLEGSPASGALAVARVGARCVEPKSLQPSHERTVAALRVHDSPSADGLQALHEETIDILVAKLPGRSKSDRFRQEARSSRIRCTAGRCGARKSTLRE